MRQNEPVGMLHHAADNGNDLSESAPVGVWEIGQRFHGIDPDNGDHVSGKLYSG